LGIALFFILVVGSLSSTADSDLAALSAIMMTDIYGRNVARGTPDPKRMLLWGRLTMVAATMLGVIFASLRLDILVMLVFVGALWGAIVFPVIVSFYWNRVTNRAFTAAVISAVVLFTLARFELIPMTGVIAVLFELFASAGAGVVIGLMTFAFFNRTMAITIGAVAALAMAYFSLGFLREYTVLLSSLTAYGVSAIVCVALSLRSQERFDFDVLAERVTSFQSASSAPVSKAGRAGSKRRPVPVHV
jgi:Na+/proline symporter